MDIIQVYPLIKLTKRWNLPWRQIYTVMSGNTFVIATRGVSDSEVVWNISGDGGNTGAEGNAGAGCNTGLWSDSSVSGSES